MCALVRYWYIAELFFLRYFQCRELSGKYYIITSERLYGKSKVKSVQADLISDSLQEKRSIARMQYLLRLSDLCDPIIFEIIYIFRSVITHLKPKNWALTIHQCATFYFITLEKVKKIANRFNTYIIATPFILAHIRVSPSINMTL